MSTSIDLDYPFTGSWRVQNSPANRVPSHGTRLLATSYAIDFVPVTDTGRTAPITRGSLLRPEPPAYRGLPSIRYALTQQRRAAAGWVALAGNHVMIESAGTIVALCHLQQDSIQVRTGQRVRVGDVLGGCGNSGNSTEPHVHVQAMDDREVERAHAVRVTFVGSLPPNGEVVHAQGA